MKRVLLLLGSIALIVSVVYVGFEVYRNFEELPSIHWSFSSLSAVLVAIFTYSFALFVWSIGWALMLRGMGENIRILSTFVIVGVSQISKYIPGNVAHHVGRLALARNHGLSISRVSASMFLELCMLVAASGSCALIALGISGAQIVYQQQGIGLIGILTLITVAFLLPLCVAFAFQRQQPAIVFKRFPESQLVPPKLKVYAINFTSHFVSFMLHGAVIVVLAHGVFGFETIDFWLAVGIFSLAWLAGFVTPGAPAGMGIRDAILVAGLSLIHPAADAIALAALHRMTTVVGDISVFLIALCLGRWVDQAKRRRKT